MKWIIGAAIACAAPAAAEPANRMSLEGTAELGILSRTHATLVGGYARRVLDDRLFVEVRVGAGTTGALWMVEERAGGGVVLHPGRRTDLLVGWRFGHSYFRGEVSNKPLDVHLYALELAVVLEIALASRWRLRMAPAVPTLLWHRTYSGSIGLEAGVAYAY